MSLERVTQSHEFVRFLEINFPLPSGKIHQTIEALHFVWTQNSVCRLIPLSVFSFSVKKP